MEERDAMSQSWPGILPDIQNLVTEGDTPVDNMPSEKQQRLLTEPLYSSWAGSGRWAPISGRRQRWCLPSGSQSGHRAGHVFESRRAGGRELVLQGASLVLSCF